MGGILCYSVRYASLREVSPKAVLITGFDGSSDIIPKSQIFGPDESVEKCDAVWIAAWILEKKNLQYSTKKKNWFAPCERRVADHIVISHKAPIISTDRHEREEIAELKSDRG